MKIDIPDNICDSHVMMGTFPRLVDKFGLNKLNRIMDKYNIKSALLMSSYIKPVEETEKILSILDGDERFYALLRSTPINYIEPDCIRSMEELIQNNNRVLGVKINSSTEHHNPLAYIYKQLFKMLNDNNAILIIHCGRWVEMSGWKYAVEIAKLYPNMKVIFAHMGGTHPELSYPAIEAVKTLKNVYMNTAQCRQTQIIEKAVETLGTDRVLFGSDMPWGNFLQNVVGIIESDLSETEKYKIFTGNFLKLVGGE